MSRPPGILWNTCRLPVYYTLFSHTCGNLETTWKGTCDLLGVWILANRDTRKEELKNKRNGGRRGASNSKIKPSWVYPRTPQRSFSTKVKGHFVLIYCLNSTTSFLSFIQHFSFNLIRSGRVNAHKQRMHQKINHVLSKYYGGSLGWAWIASKL